MRKGKYKVTKTGKEYHWTLTAKNGEPILSSHMLSSKKNYEKSIASARINGADINNFEKLKAIDGSYYFNLKAGGEHLGTSEMYPESDVRLIGIKSVMENAPDAKIVIEKEK